MLSGIRKPARIAVFISGGGSTLQALLEMHHQFDIQLVVTNRKSAPGILKAKRFGKQVYLQKPGVDFSELQQKLIQTKVEKIVLAGYMKILPECFVKLWENKIVNIHPSLLPDYPGLESAERSFKEQKDMGVSLHKVIAAMDEGKIILQQISMRQNLGASLDEALLLLRRTEQHLLRELSLRWSA